jgi:uncharacterized protein (TIGR00369 family)
MDERTKATTGYSIKIAKGVHLGRKIFEDWIGGGEPPIARLIGFRLTVFERDRAVVEFEAGPQHANPMGTLHGGVFCDVADAAMGTAWASGLAEGETCTTIELKINFFRPFRIGKLVAEASVVRRGRSIGYVECDMRDEQGRLLARAGSTCMTLRGDQAAGR